LTAIEKANWGIPENAPAHALLVDICDDPNRVGHSLRKSPLQNSLGTRGSLV
jgi:hypothetical protein